MGDEREREWEKRGRGWEFESLVLNSTERTRFEDSTHASLRYTYNHHGDPPIKKRGLQHPNQHQLFFNSETSKRHPLCMVRSNIERSKMRCASTI